MRLSVPSARHITKRMRTRKRPKRASSFLTIYLTKSRKTPCKHRLEFSCPCQSCPGIEEIQGDVSKDGVFQSLHCRHGCSGSVEITGSSPVCSTNGKPRKHGVFGVFFFCFLALRGWYFECKRAAEKAVKTPCMVACSAQNSLSSNSPSSNSPSAGRTVSERLMNTSGMVMLMQTSPVVLASM